MKKKKVLIIDDNPDICELLSDFFEKKGLSAEIASNGKEAFGCLEKDTFDLITLDEIMPVMKGFDFLKKLRSIQKYSKIPVVMLTVRTSPQDLDKGIILNTDFYLPKPISFKNLSGFVDLIL